jgi:flagellin-like hook-associated protein FlgL
MDGIQLDPTNFSMASKFDAQVHLMEGALSNAGNAMSMLQTQDGTLNSAEAALAVIKERVSQLSTDLSKVGAAQASLQAESERLTAARSSLTSAGSRITDISYAPAVTKKSAAQVQLQMASALLAHKSVNPEVALYFTLRFQLKKACSPVPAGYYLQTF